MILAMRVCVFIVFVLLELIADGGWSLTRRLSTEAARVREKVLLVALLLKDASARGAHWFGPERLARWSGIPCFLD
jgi:hypothetical protein